MPNLSQVVDIDRKGNYVRDQAALGAVHVAYGEGPEAYDDKFGVQARNNAISMILELSKKLGSGDSAEND